MISEKGEEERIWNVCLHDREYHLGYTLSTLRGTPATKAIIIPWEIREAQPQVRPVGSTEVPQTSPGAVLAEDLKRQDKIRR